MFFLPTLFDPSFLLLELGVGYDGLAGWGFYTFTMAFGMANLFLGSGFLTALGGAFVLLHSSCCLLLFLGDVRF